MGKSVNHPSPEPFDDEYDNEALEEVMAKKNAKVSVHRYACIMCAYCMEGRVDGCLVLCWVLSAI